MRKILSILFAGALLSSPALADWTGKDASGATITFKNSGVCSSVVCIPAAQPVDSTGASFGVTANPIFVAPGTGQTFPMSAASLPLPTGAATSALQTTINTTLGTPFQAGGSIGNTTFAATQATSSNLKAQVDPLTAASWGIGTSTQNSASVANGHLVLGQFNTTPTTITSTNMSPLQMDNAGNLLVNIKAGAGSGGTALADEATFTQGTTSLTPIGCLFINSYTPLTTGKAGVLSCTSAGSLHTTVDNTLTALVNNADGVAAVSAVTGTAGNSPVNSTNYVFNGTTFDRQRSATQTGSTLIGSSDPCLGANKTNLPISQSGTSSVQLVGLSGSTVIYVCSLSLIAAGATTVVLTTGTGSACVTGNAAVIGDTTANIANGLSLAANGGLTLGNGAGTIAKGASAGELCMTLGTNVRMSGNLTYVQQ